MRLHARKMITLPIDLIPASKVVRDFLAKVCPKLQIRAPRWQFPLDELVSEQVNFQLIESVLLQSSFPDCTKEAMREFFAAIRILTAAAVKCVENGATCNDLRRMAAFTLKHHNHVKEVPNA